MTSRCGRAHAAAGVLCTLLLVPVPALAAPNSASVSPDITVVLSTVNTADEDVSVDNLLGIVVPASIGTLPSETDVAAYTLLPNGDQLLAFDTTVELPGPITVERGDVVRYDGGDYTLEFDASANGVPNGAIADAVTTTPLGDLVLSFDTTVVLGTLTVADEDLVEFDGSTFSSLFDASAAGVPTALDVDGAHVLPDGNLALSFDTSGNLGSVDFDDEDVLEYDPAGPTWTLVYDGSAEHAAWSAADLNAIALPEPGFLLPLSAGLALLVALTRLRSRR